MKVRDVDKTLAFLGIFFIALGFEATHTQVSNQLKVQLKYDFARIGISRMMMARYLLPLFHFL